MAALRRTGDHPVYTDVGCIELDIFTRINHQLRRCQDFRAYTVLHLLQVADENMQIKGANRMAVVNTVRIRPSLSVLGLRECYHDGHSVEHGRCLRRNMGPLEKASLRDVILPIEAATTNRQPDEALVVPRHVIQ